MQAEKQRKTINLRGQKTLLHTVNVLCIDVPRVLFTLDATTHERRIVARPFAVSGIAERCVTANRRLFGASSALGRRSWPGARTSRCSLTRYRAQAPELHILSLTRMQNLRAAELLRIEAHRPLLVDIVCQQTVPRSRENIRESLERPRVSRRGAA